jgi:hypothetical protein
MGHLGHAPRLPMMMVIKVICDRVEALQPVGHFLGD